MTQQAIIGAIWTDSGESVESIEGILQLPEPNSPTLSSTPNGDGTNTYVWTPPNAPEPSAFTDCKSTGGDIQIPTLPDTSDTPQDLTVVTLVMTGPISNTNNLPLMAGGVVNEENLQFLADTIFDNVVGDVDTVTVSLEVLANSVNININISGINGLYYQSPSAPRIKFGYTGSTSGLSLKDVYITNSSCSPSVNGIIATASFDNGSISWVA